MFATTQDLATFTGDDSLDSDRGALIIDMASAIIRNYCRQTFDLVENDEVELRGTRRSRLLLPERPVVSVSSVTVDGDPVDTYRKVRDGLWRAEGWGGEDRLVEVVYTHGFAPNDPAWGVLAGVCLQVSARAAANPQSLNSFTAAAGDGIGFGGGGTGSQVLGLTNAERAILDRFRHEKATAL